VSFLKRFILLLLAAVMPMGVFGDEKDDFLKEVYYGFYDDSVGKVKAYVETGKGDPLLYSMAFAGLCGGMPNGADPDPKIDQMEQNCILIGQLLLEKGADINAFRNIFGRDDNALLRAALLKHTKRMIPFLLSRKANPNVRNSEGTTPLMRGAFIGTSANIEALLNAGAKINDVNKNRWTALHQAAHWGNAATAKVLLEHKAVMNAKNADGLTPLNLAELNNDVFNSRRDVIALLRKSGAKENKMPPKFAAKLAEKNSSTSTTSAPPRICLAFDATGALTCRDMPGSSCPGNRFWAGPGPCSTYNNKTVKQLNKSEWGSLIFAFNGEAEDRNKVDEPKRESKLERCQKACRFQKCGSKMSGEYTASPSAGLRCAGFCDQECSTNPNAYR
jgi:ankyrin repeat protein